MTIVSSHKDTTALTLTFVADFDADVDRVWQVWQDPRQLERWWGPPGYPATFEVHNFVPGGSSRYYMTTPEGEKPRGWWTFTAIDAPHGFEFDEGFADDNGDPSPDVEPAHCVVSLEERSGGTRMITTSHFVSTEQLTQMMEMGMEEGMREAMGQIDSLLLPTSVQR